jgi:hypothetical protein
MLKAWLGLSLASNFAPSPSSLLRAQQRLGDALDRAADAALAPATNMLQPDAPQQQRSIFAEAAHSEEEERAQLPTSLVPSWRAGRQSGTGSGRHVKYRRDMLTRKAIPARRSVAERLEAQMNATLRPAIQEQPQLRQPKRVSETRPTQVSGGERAAQFTRKYESVFWASLAPQIEFETDESSPGGRATGDVRTSSDNRPRRFSGFMR